MLHTLRKRGVAGDCLRGGHDDTHTTPPMGPTDYLYGGCCVTLIRRGVNVLLVGCSLTTLGEYSLVCIKKNSTLHLPLPCFHNLCAQMHPLIHIIHSIHNLPHGVPHQDSNRRLLGCETTAVSAAPQRQHVLLLFPNWF